MFNRLVEHNVRHPPTFVNRMVEQIRCYESGWGDGPMWLISAKDLQFRLRRFVIAVTVTGIVFGMALAFDAIKQALQAEGPRIVHLFHADQWVVANGASGPFTTAQVIPSSVASELREQPSVRDADPVVVSRSVVEAENDFDVNVIGFRIDGMGAPPIHEGRAPRAIDEVVVTKPIDAEVGSVVRIGGKRFRVVGRNDNASFNFGIPTVFLPLAPAYDVVFDGRALANAIAVRGDAQLPPTVEVLSNHEVEVDMRRPLKGGISTIDFVSLLLWLLAAGIIGSIIYLTALERSRDFAVFKATGMPMRTITGGLAAQAVFLALLAAVLAIGLAHLIVLGIPFPSRIGASSIAQLLVIAFFVGLVASVASLRRVRTTDPALAFGGA
jgi:putative ABC transport system permease protein